MLSGCLDIDGIRVREFRASSFVGVQAYIVEVLRFITGLSFDAVAQVAGLFRFHFSLIQVRVDFASEPLLAAHTKPTARPRLHFAGGASDVGPAAFGA